MPNFSPDGLIAFWNSMSPKQRQALAENLKNFHALRSSLEGRGIIETDKNLSRITILKDSKEVKELLSLLKKTGAQGITIEKKRSKTNT